MRAAYLLSAHFLHTQKISHIASLPLSTAKVYSLIVIANFVRLIQGHFAPSERIAGRFASFSFWIATTASLRQHIIQIVPPHPRGNNAIVALQIIPLREGGIKGGFEREGGGGLTKGVLKSIVISVNNSE